METKYVQTVSTFAMIALAASPLSAQEMYGYVGLTAQDNNVENILGDPAVGDPGNEPFDFAQYGIRGALGMNFAGGMYGQIDFRFQDTDVPATTDDTLHDGAMVALRAGREFDGFRAGAFLGYVDVTGDDSVGSNKMYRAIYGIEGEYDLDGTTSLFAEIGGIGDPKGSQGTGGDDGIHNGTYALIGLNWSLSDSLTIDGHLGVANGTHDNDPLDINFAGIGANYQTNIDGLSAYIRADFTNFYQHVENEEMATTTMQFGVTYAFGSRNGSGNQLRALAPYEDWMGYSGGHLE